MTSLPFVLIGALALSLAFPAAAAAATPRALVTVQTIRMPAHRWIGYYVPGAPYDMAPLAALETKTGAPAAFITYYQNPYEPAVFDEFQARRAVEHGSMPFIALELRDVRRGVSQPDWSLDSITRGEHDAYLRKYAREAKAFGHEVWIRPFHEMNGNWYSYGGTVNGNTPADFAPAWRHVVTVFRQEGATNVKWVWCPNHESIPITSANAISRYWPGDAYVDYMALDGYNWGTADGIVWRSFESLYEDPYAEMTALSDKPVFVAEVACATIGGDKAAWVAEMFRVIPERFPRILGIGWFNGTGERDWRIDSSLGSLYAFKSGALGSSWTDRVAPPETLTRDRRSQRGLPATPGMVADPAAAGRAR